MMPRSRCEWSAKRRRGSATVSPATWPARPACHHCRNTSWPTGKLGGAVADALATDIFRLVREDALDVAVLLSAQPALGPVIRFVEGRGKRVVHAAFPPRGRELSEVSAGMVDLTALRP